MGEVLEETFRAFGRSWVALVVGYLVMLMICMAPLALWAVVSFVPMLLRGESAPPVFGDGAIIGSALLAGSGTLLLAILFAPAQARIALAAARHQSPRIAQVFDFRRAGTLFCASLLGGLAALGGFFLLIVPGIIIATGLQLASFFVVDSEAGALEALRESWRATRGHRAHLFGFMLLMGIASAVVQAMLGVAIIVTAPLQMLAMATIYERLRPVPPPAALALDSVTLAS
jgi:hypothetical protein